MRLSALFLLNLVTSESFSSITQKKDLPRRLDKPMEESPQKCFNGLTRFGTSS